MGGLAVRLFSIGGLAMPGFWVGILTILCLLVFFHYLPPLTFTPFLENPLGGLLVTEQVFNLNGIGKLMVDAVVRSDYTMTQALIMLIASAFVATNFLIDVLYAVLSFW